LRAALVTSRHFASERAPNQLFADQSHQQYAWSAPKEAHLRALFCLQLSAEGPYCFTAEVGMAKNLSGENCSCLEQTIGRAGGSRSLGGKTDVYSLA
jgi:hypothetical protein